MVKHRFVASGSSGTEDGEYARRNNRGLPGLTVGWGIAGFLFFFLFQQTIQKTGIDLGRAKIRVAEDAPEQR